MFSPDDDFLAEHHLDLRNYYPHHHQPPSSASAALYRHLKTTSAATSASSALSNYSRSQYQDSNLGSSITSTASRISIREATDHLQLLNQRVGDLEDIIRSQGSALSGKDIDFRRQIQELKESKERQISELSMVIAKLEGKNQELAYEIQEKSDHLNGCQQKLLMLDQILTTSLPPLEQLISNLKQFSLNNPEIVQLTNPVTSFTMTNECDGEGVKNAGLTVESAAKALQRSPVILSPSVRSPNIRSPAIRSPAARTNRGIVEEIPTAHLISATSALINSSIMDVQSNDSGNASDSSRTNSYGQVLDELKEVQQYQQQHSYAGIVSSPRRRSLEKQKPVEEAIPIPTIVETSISNDLAKDVDITDELNRGRKPTRKLPHAFGKTEIENCTSNPVQISSQLMMNHTVNVPSQLSPSINRVMNTRVLQNEGQVLSSPSMIERGGITTNPPSTYSNISSPLKSHQNQMHLMAAKLQASMPGPTASQLYQQYQQRTNLIAVSVQRSSMGNDAEIISKLNSEKRQLSQPMRYDRNNYNNNNYGQNYDFCDEDLDYDEEDEYEVDDDAPPPPAPPPSTNTSNISLPSLQAPRRYLHSSHHAN